MQSVARPSVAVTAVALIAGGVCGVAPMTPPAHTPAVQLTAGLGELADLQLESNAQLAGTMLRANTGITHGEQVFLGNLAGDLAPDNQSGAFAVLQQLQESYNLTMGASQGALLGALGVRVIDPSTGAVFDPAALNASLLFTGDSGGDSSIGGALGALLHATLAAVALGELTGREVDPGKIDELVDKIQTLNTTLLDSQKAFNAELVSNEVALERAMFGTDSALNGAVNRAFNSFNMLFDTQQQSLNGFLGVTGYNPQELTASLLTGSDQQVFNDGAIGGLQGMLDQNLAGWADLGGLQAGDLNGLFDHFDSAAVSDATQALLETLIAGPFGDAFSADLG